MSLSPNSAMSQKRRFRRPAEPVAVHQVRQLTPEDRLDDLLTEWGEHVRHFNPVGHLGFGKAPAFRDAQCGVEWSIDTYDAVDVERMRIVNASVDDLRVNTREWIVIHWHYAHGAGHGPAVWRHNRLPSFGSDDYLVLLTNARSGVERGIRLRRGDYLLE